MRGKRRTQGLQKAKELEQKVQALEEAINVDVRTALISLMILSNSTSH